MKIYTVENGNFVLTEIPNTLKAMQKFVDGYIEIVKVIDEILLVCNEEGKLRGLPSTAVIKYNEQIKDTIKGNFFLCRAKGEDMGSIFETDIAKFKDILIPISNEIL